MGRRDLVRSVSGRQIDYYLQKAKGGGLITTEELTVRPSGMAYEKLVDAFKPEVIPGFQMLTRAVLRLGAIPFAILFEDRLQLAVWNWDHFQAQWLLHRRKNVRNHNNCRRYKWWRTPGADAGHNNASRAG